MSKGEMKKIQIWVQPKAYEEMHQRALKVDAECGGLARIESIGPGKYWVTEPWMLSQTVSRTSCVLDPFEWNEHKKAKGWWGQEMPQILECHWHSHHTMEVFASVTDQELYESNSSRGMFVGLIVNRKWGEIHASAWTWIGDGTQEGSFAVEMATEVIVRELLTEDRIKEIEEEIKEKVEVERVSVSVGAGFTGTGFVDDGWERTSNGWVKSYGETETKVLGKWNGDKGKSKVLGQLRWAVTRGKKRFSIHDQTTGETLVMKLDSQGCAKLSVLTKIPFGDLRQMKTGEVIRG